MCEVNKQIKRGRGISSLLLAVPYLTTLSFFKCAFLVKEAKSIKLVDNYGLFIGQSAVGICGLLLGRIVRYVWVGCVQCDQIWQNFATLAKLKNSLAIL